MSPLPPTSAAVECAGARHRLRWQDGTLSTPEHADPNRERALTALGGEPYRCLQLLDAWHRHVDDLDVLLLASRGLQDRIVAQSGHQHAHAGPGVHYGGNWRSYSPMTSVVGARRTSFSSAAAGGRGGDASDRDGVGLPDLLRLGGGLPDRLTAQVVDTWSLRLAAGDDAAAVARPRLQAALYGRFAPVVRGWLGEPDLRVELAMCGPDAVTTLERTDEVLRAQLPFGWLADVWLPGLAVLADRLCLAARQPVSGRYELQTLGRDLADRTRVRLEIAPHTA